MDFQPSNFDFKTLLDDPDNIKTNFKPIFKAFLQILETL